MYVENTYGAVNEAEEERQGAEEEKQDAEEEKQGAEKGKQGACNSHERSLSGHLTLCRIRSRIEFPRLRSYTIALESQSNAVGKGSVRLSCDGLRWRRWASDYA